MTTTTVAEASAAPSGRWIDPVGGAVSVACAIHCLAAPLFLVVAPAVASEGLETGLLVGASALAGLTAVLSWRRFRTWPVPALASIGVGLCVARLALEESPFELAFSLSAAAAFVTAHLLHMRARRAAEACC